jgi:geranylgeranyl diphosphate synthase type II
MNSKTSESMASEDGVKKKPDSGENLEGFLERVCARVESRLQDVLPPASENPASLHDAMRYSVFAGGKRLRPALVYASALCTGGMGWGDIPDAVDDAAAAVELIHTYSLIHDDLPCMDDDDLRRGKPTNHKVYGEAVAVLAGDALLTLAFEVLAGDEPDPSEAAARGRAAAALARAAGSRGMVGGQVADIEGEGATATESALDFIQENKTAALITASLEMGALLANAKPNEIKALGEFGQALGLAFQTVDDILGEVGESDRMGKPVGSDAEHEKLTAVRVLGVDGARTRARDLLDEARKRLAPFGSRATVLGALADFVGNRNL